jgi:hypothetical protein
MFIPEPMVKRINPTSIKIVVIRGDSDGSDIQETDSTSDHGMLTRALDVVSSFIILRSIRNIHMNYLCTSSYDNIASDVLTLIIEHS